MANLQMIRAGYTAGEAKDVVTGRSLTKESALVITPDAELEYEPAGEISDDAEGAPDVRLNIFNWSKTELLRKRDAGEYTSSIRSERDGKIAKEYDHLALTFSAEESRALTGNPDAQAKILEAVKAVTRGARGGQKAALITDVHFDTSNAHVHFLLHRYAVDTVGKKIDVSDDLSKRSEASDFLNRLNKEMEIRGMPVLNDFRLSDGSGLMNDVNRSEAKAAVSDMVEEAGGKPVLVAKSDLSGIKIEHAALVRLEENSRSEAEKAQSEIIRLQKAQAEAIQRVTLAQQAQAALIERDEAVEKAAAAEATKLEALALAAERDAARIASELEARAAEVERDKLAERAMTLQSALEDAVSEKTELKAQVLDLSSELSIEVEKGEQQEKVIENLTVEKSGLELQITELSADLTAAANHIDEQRAQIMQQIDLAKSQASMLEQQRVMIDTLAVQVKTQAETISAAEAERARQAEEIARLATEKEAAAQALAAAAAEKSSMADDLAAAAVDREAQLNEIARLEKIATENAESAATLSEELTEKDEEIQLLLNRIAALEKQTQELLDADTTAAPASKKPAPTDDDDNNNDGGAAPGR